VISEMCKRRRRDEQTENRHTMRISAQP
jgi:hypothetical protein